MKRLTSDAYAVAVWTGRRYIYFAGYVDDAQALTLYPCCAKLYTRKEDAAACADFLDSSNQWEVVTMFEKD